MTNKIAIRDSYGNALLKLGKEFEDVIVLDADLSSATKTGDFAKTFPERYLNIGIAENNMVCVAAGLASSGKIPIVNSFAMFSAGRSFEQIRNSVAYPNLNVKIVGTHTGLSVGKDGATHQCFEDIAIMRSIPNMTILCPADEVETYHCLRAAITHDGPVYLRIARMPVEQINEESNYNFELGKGILQKPGKDVTIVTTGFMLQRALAARENLLQHDNIEARIVHLPTIKPIDKDIIIQAAQETKFIVTAENHNVLGGLGGAVAEVVGEYAPTLVKKIGVQDVFGKSGDPEELIKEFGLDYLSIVNTVKEGLSQI